MTRAQPRRHRAHAFATLTLFQAPDTEGGGGVLRPVTGYGYLLRSWPRIAPPGNFVVWTFA